MHSWIANAGGGFTISYQCCTNISCMSMTKGTNSFQSISLTLYSSENVGAVQFKQNITHFDTCHTKHSQIKQ